MIVGGSGFLFAISASKALRWQVAGFRHRYEVMQPTVPRVPNVKTGSSRERILFYMPMWTGHGLHNSRWHSVGNSRHHDIPECT